MEVADGGKKKQHSKSLFSMFYSVVKNHSTRSSANYILHLSFFAYLFRSRLVTTNSHYFFSFYTLYELFIPIYNDQLLQK